MRSTWLHWYCVLLAVATLFLVVAGASVTSNDAGLSVPDWPLSYGRLMPPMEGGIFYEHGHRMVATTVGLLTIVLAVWLSLREQRRWMRRLGLAALAAVVAQGILGGVTVIFMLPKPVSITHACLAELFFSTTVALAVFTSRSWMEGPRMVEDSGWPSMRWKTCGPSTRRWAAPGPPTSHWPTASWPMPPATKRRSTASFRAPNR
ncbi:MAG: COX15/CtaA family protein [Acidobacteria bacterium]|nr:COX15/CtaA family protein [Acidobacteriota bacterium]